MNINKINSQLFNIYLHILPIGIILSAFFTEYYIQLLLLSILSIITLIVNFRIIKKKILMLYLFILFLIFLNLLSTEYQSYVVIDSFNLMLFSFVPIILVSSGITVKYIETVFKSALIYSILYLAIGYILRKNLMIDYFDLGIITHFNVITLLLNSIIHKRIKFLPFLCLLLNVSVGLLLGSRMVSIASIILLIIGIGMVYRDNKFKNKAWYAFIISILFVVITNIINILNFISAKLEVYGINSRNITLFKQQIMNALQNSTNDSQVYSGRDTIYPTIVKYLMEDGLFPNGLSMGRILTNNLFYHSHNFILEVLLIFGLLIGIGVLTILMIRTVYVFIKWKSSVKFIMLLLCLSFVIRSMTGTYFIKDYFFWTSLSLVLFFKEENIYEQ